MEEEWHLFQGFDSHDPRPARAIVESHDNPLKVGTGYKNAPRRLSNETIKQLCPTGQSMRHDKKTYVHRDIRYPTTLSSCSYMVGSGDLLSENFNPVVFLLEKHCASSFDELQCGLDNLRREVAKSEQAPAQFIRDNLDAFIQCYDTLSDIPPPPHTH